MATVFNTNWIAGGTIANGALLKQDATNPGQELIACTADTDRPIAVAINAANTTYPATLQYEMLKNGKVTVNASGAISAANAELACTTAGAVKVAEAGDVVVGFAASTAADGESFEMIVCLSQYTKA